MNIALLWLAASLPSTSLAAPAEDYATEIRLSEHAEYPGRVVEGEGVLVLPAGTRDWLPSERNSAIAPGDLIRTGATAATLELSPSWLVHAGPSTDLSFSRERGIEVMRLRQGTLVSCSFDAEVAASIVVPGAAAWLAPGGFYRVEVSGTQSTIRVNSGMAEVEFGGRVKKVKAGRSLTVGGVTSKMRVVRDSGRRWDELDRSAEEACMRRSDGTVRWGLTGERDLLAAGRWRMVDGVRYWIPQNVAVDWQPFDDGCFRHHPSLGWYFVPHESWGWVTHHHGRWVRLGGHGWAWLPGRDWYGHRVSFWTDRQSVYWCPRRNQSGRTDGTNVTNSQPRFTHAPAADFRRRLPARGRRVPDELTPINQNLPVINAQRIARPPGSLPGLEPEQGNLGQPGDKVRTAIRRDSRSDPRQPVRLDSSPRVGSPPAATVPAHGGFRTLPAPRLAPLPGTTKRLDRDRRMRELAERLPDLKQGTAHPTTERKRPSADRSEQRTRIQDRQEPKRRDTRTVRPPERRPVVPDKPLNKQKPEQVKRERPAPAPRVTPKPAPKPRPIRERPAPRPKKDER